MKASLRIIGATLIVLGIFAGLASAESPDACNPADYGGAWSCGKLFSSPNHDYAFVDGILANPNDNVDLWRSTDPVGGDTLLLYLDGNAYANDVTARLYNGNKVIMQQISSPAGSYEATRILNPAPAYVNITGFPNDKAYTFALRRN